NYLLNIGPTPMGDVPGEAKSRLNEMGKWMSEYGESIYGTQRSLIYPAWGECTRKDVGNKTVLYLCVSEWPKDGKLIFDANYKIKKASLLNNNSTLKVDRKNRQITIQVPQQAPNKYVSVIKLELNEKLPVSKLISNTDKYFEIADEQK
ncbi:MAG: alpha-L-fucosidase, partial [Proteiniphilum sp.]